MSYLGKVDMNDANIKHYSLTGSTLTTVNIGWVPASEQSLRVTINGVVQQGDTFSYSGANLTLGGPLVVTDTLEVVGIQSVGNMITPADNSVTTTKLADDAVTLAKMAGGTDGNLITYDASGDPAYVATGAATNVLTSNGAGAAPTFQAPAAGGNTHASQWRLTTSFNNSVDPITSNLEAVIAAAPDTSTASPTSSTALGAPMTLASGIFTFPVTGYWLVEAIGVGDWETYNANPGGVFINYTTDNSVYAGITKENAIVYLGYYSNSSASVVLDITDTSLCKVSFGFVARGATDTCIGDAVKNSTCMSFVRLGDT